MRTKLFSPHINEPNALVILPMKVHYFVHPVGFCSSLSGRINPRQAYSILSLYIPEIDTPALFAREHIAPIRRKPLFGIANNLSLQQADALSALCLPDARQTVVGSTENSG